MADYQPRELKARTSENFTELYKQTLGFFIKNAQKVPTTSLIEANCDGIKKVYHLAHATAILTGFNSYNKGWLKLRLIGREGLEKTVAAICKAIPDFKETPPSE